MPTRFASNAVVVIMHDLGRSDRRGDQCPRALVLYMSTVSSGSDSFLYRRAIQVSSVLHYPSPTPAYKSFIYHSPAMAWHLAPCQITSHPTPGVARSTTSVGTESTVIPITCTICISIFGAPHLLDLGLLLHRALAIGHQTQKRVWPGQGIQAPSIARALAVWRVWCG